MAYVIQTSHLTKSIGSRELIHDVSLHVSKGEIYGFLGPNGAGKTTIMKMLTNLWKPTGGTIELFGSKLTPTSYEVLKRMGSIIEFPTFFDHMSGYDNLALHCEYLGYYSPGCIENVLKILGLEETGTKPVKSYSLGMKQRLGIARAVLSKPELLILDEPTNGLDPAGMKQIRDLLKMLCTEYGITVMISTHILSEIESIADTIGVLSHGRLLNEITMEELTDKNTSYIELETDNTRRAAFLLSDTMKLKNFKIMDSGSIRIYDSSARSQDISGVLGRDGVEIRTIRTQSETLEDYFLKLTAEVQ